MIKTIWRFSALAVAAGALAACGGSGVQVAPPPQPKPNLEDMFGTGFGIDFRANANSEPVVPMASDIIPLSLTTEPIPLHG